MKNYLFVLFLFLFTASFAQTPSCCRKPEGMAVFASNERFIATHENPIPLNYESKNGERITFPTADGKTGSAFMIASEKKTNNILFVFHEWWGLNDYIKREAETLQKELGNVTVYAVDLYDGQVATEKEIASEIMQTLKPERCQSIINGLIKHIGKGNKIATLGWCMGGGWSLQASLLAGQQSSACVMYYGFPEKDKEKLKALKSEVLFIQATQDQFITKEVVTRFGDDLKDMGKKITIKRYDADHAFANPSNPKYKKDFADEAHKLAVDFIKKRF